MAKSLETRLSSLEQAMQDGSIGSGAMVIGERRFQHALRVIYGEPSDAPVTIETAADAARHARAFDAAIEAAYGEQET